MNEEIHVIVEHIIDKVEHIIDKYMDSDFKIRQPYTFNRVLMIQELVAYIESLLKSREDEKTVKKSNILDKNEIIT